MLPIRALLFVVNMLIVFVSFSQSIYSGFEKKIEAKFLNTEVSIVRGEMLSNVLMVKNLSDDPLDFRITLNAPSGWRKVFFNINRFYSVGAKDSIFIPIRISPSQLMKGNTKYYINAFIYGDKEDLLSSAYFYGTTKKITDWTVSVEPGTKLYFLNDENSYDYSVNIFNKGNEDQDIALNMQNIGYYGIIEDTLSGKSREIYNNFYLAPLSDTTFNYTFHILNRKRNKSFIDLDEYSPNYVDEEKKLNVYINTVEPGDFSNGTYRRGEKITFVKLPNKKKVNKFNSDVLPLNADFNAFNLFDRFFISVLTLRGFRFFPEINGQLYYYTNLYYYSFFSREDNLRNLRTANLFISYYDKRKRIIFGNIRGGYGLGSSNLTAGLGLSASGKGVSAMYKVSKISRLSGYIIRSPYILNFKDMGAVSYGLTHALSIPFLQGIGFSTGINQNFTPKTSASGYTLSLSKGLSIYRGNKISLNVIRAQSRTYNKETGVRLTGQPVYNFSARMSTKFKIGEKIRGNGSLYYYPAFRSAITARDTLLTEKLKNGNINLYHQTAYDDNGVLNVNMTNNYQKQGTYIYRSDQNFFRGNSFNFNNTLTVSSAKYAKGYSFRMYYNVLSRNNIDLYLRGLGFGHNSYDVENNFRTAYSVSMGLSKSSLVDTTNYFYFRINSYTKYKNISVNANYNVGRISPRISEASNELDIVPQYFRVGLSHQYQFDSRFFVLKSTANYSYNNIFKQHSLTLVPDLYYFTKNGWRFNVNISYNLTSNRFYKEYSYNYNSGNSNGYQVIPESQVEEDSPDRSFNQTYPVNVGIRKEFGIPIPGRISKFKRLDLIAFYDLNGNKQKDKNEPSIENVVISVNGWEVLTNSEGMAQVHNIPIGTYKFTAWSLVDLKGWFPKIRDSIMVVNHAEVAVPFVRGVKVIGNVFLDREEMAVDSDIPFDLSGIKITAHDGETYNTLTGFDGAFEFYLPYAKYVFTMDEKVLGSRFRLLKNDIPLDLTEAVDNVYISFQIIERRRRVRIKKFGNGSNSNSDSKQDNKPFKIYRGKNRNNSDGNQNNNGNGSKNSSLYIEEGQNNNNIDQNSQFKRFDSNGPMQNGSNQNMQVDNSQNNTSVNQRNQTQSNNQVPEIVNQAEPENVSGQDIEELTQNMNDAVNKQQQANPPTNNKPQNNTAQNTNNQNQEPELRPVPPVDNNETNDNGTKKFESYIDTNQALEYLSKILEDNEGQLPEVVEVADEAVNQRDLEMLQDLMQQLRNKDDNFDDVDINDVQIDGLVYRLQVAASATRVPPTFFAEKYDIRDRVYAFQTKDGSYNYTVGNFKTKNEALNYLEELRNTKRANAFITYYFKNKRVTWGQLKDVFNKVVKQ